MSEWWKHAIVSTLSAIPFLLLTWQLTGAEIGPLDLVALFCYDLPDSDLRKVKSPLIPEGTRHRHWFWHSCLIPTMCFLLGARIGVFNGVATVCVVIGAHLLADIKRKGKKVGTYLIYLRKGDRMSAKRTDRYLAVNGLVCVILGLVSLFM